MVIRRIITLHTNWAIIHNFLIAFILKLSHFLDYVTKKMVCQVKTIVNAHFSCAHVPFVPERSLLVSCLNVVVAGCDNGSNSHFIKIQSIQISDQGMWPKQDPTGLDQAILWFSAACTSKDRYKESIGLT